jgi:hypothetical protein
MLKHIHEYQPRFLQTVALFLIAATIAVFAAPLSAHEVTREKGFYIGARLAGSTLHIDDDGDQIFKIKEDGGALFLITGYSFNRVFSLELALGGAGHETSVPTIDATLGTFQFFLHYRFRPGHALRPYVKGGLGGYGLRLEETSGANVRIEGGGVPIGIGCDYFFSNHFSLGLDLTHNIINYDTVTIDLGDGATTGFEMDEAGAMTNIGLTLTGYF